MTAMESLIGTRCLMRLSHAGHWSGAVTVDEFKILEVSPSGNWVKLMNLNGRKFWRSAAEISVIEQLKDVRSGRPLS